jgi:hypothetical protein
MAKQSDPNFSKSGVPKAAQSGAKQVEKPTRKPMSDRTASAAGRWPKRDEAWSAPDPNESAYAPPKAEPLKGAATSNDNKWAVEWLEPDYSNRRGKPDLMK